MITPNPNICLSSKHDDSLPQTPAFSTLLPQSQACYSLCLPFRRNVSFVFSCFVHSANSTSETSTPQKPCLPRRYNDNPIYERHVEFNLPMQPRTIIPNHLLALKENEDTLARICLLYFGIVGVRQCGAWSMLAIEKGRQVRNEIFVHTTIAIRHKYPKYCACR